MYYSFHQKLFTWYWAIVETAPTTKGIQGNNNEFAFLIILHRICGWGKKNNSEKVCQKTKGKLWDYDEDN